VPIAFPQINDDQAYKAVFLTDTWTSKAMEFSTPGFESFKEFKQVQFSYSAGPLVTEQQRPDTGSRSSDQTTVTNSCALQPFGFAP
jgi:hypothetical protein